MEPDKETAMKTNTIGRVAVLLVLAMMTGQRVAHAGYWYCQKYAWNASTNERRMVGITHFECGAAGVCSDLSHTQPTSVVDIAGGLSQTCENDARSFYGPLAGGEWNGCNNNPSLVQVSKGKQDVLGVNQLWNQWPLYWKGGNWNTTNLNFLNGHIEYMPDPFASVYDLDTCIDKQHINTIYWGPIAVKSTLVAGSSAEPAPGAYGFARFDIRGTAPVKCSGSPILCQDRGQVCSDLEVWALYECNYLGHAVQCKNSLGNYVDCQTGCGCNQCFDAAGQPAPCPSTCTSTCTTPPSPANYCYKASGAITSCTGGCECTSCYNGSYQPVTCPSTCTGSCNTSAPAAYCYKPNYTQTSCAAAGCNCTLCYDVNYNVVTCPSTCTDACSTGGGTTCTPTTCAAQGKNCGTIADGCGGTLSCGTCAAGQTCSANVCVSSGGTGSCAHSVCSIGTALPSSCSSCAGTVCASDSYCCTTSWDQTCVSEATSLCGVCG
jgi:hypothetical protein